MAKKFISQFTGEEIDARLAAVSDKVGYTFFNSSDGNTLYSFASEETYNQWVEEGMNLNSELIIDKTPFSFEGTMRRLTVVNLLTTQNPYFTTNKKSAILRFGYSSQYKGITEPDWQDFDENAKVTVEVDKGFTGEFIKIVDGQQLLNGRDFEIDVYQHIAVGDNKVRVTVVGETTNTKGTLTYTVALTSMYMLPSANGVNWHQPLIQGETFNLGGFNIGGTVNKTVKVRVAYSNSNGETTYTDYEENIGTKIYVNTAYSFKLNLANNFPVNNTDEPVTSVCKVEVWTEAGNASTDKLTYYLMFVSAENKNTAKLACINDIREIKNGATEELFQFAIYDGTNGKGSAQVLVGFENHSLINQTLEVDTITKHSITTEVNEDSEAGRFELNASVNVVGGPVMYADIPVDNSANYPAESGYTFYFNSAPRSNGESDKNMVNEVNGAKIISSYTNISWVDGLDGYTTDEQGFKGLRIPAKCKAEFNLFPLSTIGNNGVTIEMLYKVSYPSDTNEPIISIATKRAKDSYLNDDFSGLMVTPNTVVLNKTKTNVRDAQSYNLMDNDIVHLMVTIVPRYKSYNGNLAQVYVNASKKISFEYSDASDFILNDAKLILGSQTADLMFYKMRIYPQGFTWESAFKNFVNCYPVYGEKASIYSKVIDIVTENFDIDYEKCKAKGFNTMVIEMLTEDGKLPSRVSDVESGNSNVTFSIHKYIDREMDEDFKKFFNIGNTGTPYVIENELCEGQGTTAMKYARWNFRWKMKAHNKRRITAKKNVASSMQSHKMGATRMYNDAYFYLYNAKKTLAEGTILPSTGENDFPTTPRVAVYQYPVFGFQKTTNDEGEVIYEPIGLYTVGPDKGDKDTFNYGEDETLIRMEGADHDKAGVGFEYPWSAMEFKSEFLGGYEDTGTRAEAWEIGECYGLELKEGKEGYDKSAVQQILDEEFKDAYEVAFSNNPYVIGLTAEEWDEMNADPELWRDKTVESGEYQGRPLKDFQFYKQGEYILYYFNVQYGDFRSTGVNVVADLSLSVSDKTEAEIQTLVREGRRARFKSNAGNYWSLWDSIYHYSFVQFLGATDNFMKNTYPYKFKKLADGGRWRWVQDDLDTIMDINNQGAVTKTYSIMVGDRYEGNNDAIYVGDSSVFWTLIRECYAAEVREMSCNILDALYSLSGSNSAKIEGVMKYFRDRWFAYAQDYFGIAGYNEDAEWTYEDIWGYKMAGNSYQEADVLRQALGNHYEAEYQWIHQRVIFFSSMVGYGDFGGGDEYAGKLSYRAGGAHTFHITPAMDMSLAVGLTGSTPSNNFTRVKAGQTADLSYPHYSDSQMELKGFDYMSDIGDLSTLKTGATSTALTFSSKMLSKINIGNEDPTKVTTNVSKLTISNCPSLESINAKNATTIADVLDLTNSPRITSVDASGTNITEVKLPNGSKIETLRLPESVASISFVRLPKLNPIEGFSVDGYANLQKLRLEDNQHIDGFAMLKEAYQRSDALAYLRIIGFNYSGTAEDVTMLKNVASETTASGSNKYHGIDADGNVTSGIPVIQGTLTLSTPVYKSELEEVEALYNSDSLHIESDKYYIEFEDPEVLRVLLEAEIGDGYGVMQSGSDYLDADEVTVELRSYNGGTQSPFKGNTKITKFNELSLFTNPMLNLYGTFSGCTSLQEVTMPKREIKQTWEYMFEDCSSLERVRYEEGTVITTLGYNSFKGTRLSSLDFDISNVTTMNGNTFRGCKELKIDVVLNASIITGGGTTFYDSGIKSFSAPNLTAFTSGAQMCSMCLNLVSVNIPKLAIIPNGFFDGCTNIETIVLNEKLTQIGPGGFQSCFSQNSDIHIALPELTNLGDYSFRYSNIRTFVAEKLTQLPNATFRNCALLTEVNLPSVTKIESYSFSGCTSLKTVNLPVAETIGDLAFRDAIIEDIYMPNVVNIGEEVFKNMNIDDAYELYELKTIGRSAFNGAKIQKLTCSKLESIGQNAFYESAILQIVQNSSVPLSIGSSAFNKCVNLTRVDVDNLVGVSGSAFNECVQLVSINVGNVESVGGSAFKNCSSLRQDFICPNLVSIAGAAFYGTGLERIIAPNVGGEIGTYVFQYSNNIKELVLGNVVSIAQHSINQMAQLGRVIFYFESLPQTLGTGNFDLCNNCLIYVPDAFVDDIKKLTGWSAYASRIKSFSEGSIPTDKEVLLAQYTTRQ